MELIQQIVLLTHLVGLHEHHLSIVGGHDSCLQEILLLVGFMLQDVHGQQQQFVASGGIDIGSVEMAVLHL